MEACTHQVQYNGLCALCGSLVEDSFDNQQGPGINMGYDSVGITVSREEAERLEAENARRLLKIRKLSLILDLDQTILHASRDQSLNESSIIKKDDDIRHFVLPQSSAVYYIKLRPGLSEFLKEIEQLYELHIYTMGTRDYAEAVANEIDPDGTIFKERILSRDESGSLTQKKLQRLFPCDTSMVVVVDDRSDIWNFSSNLIRIKPYKFFFETGDINSSTLKKIAERSVTLNSADVAGDNKKVNDSIDNELYAMSKILRNIHSDFYSKDSRDKEADVTHIIPQMKKHVLENIVLTFDMIPVVKDPSYSWIWQMSTSFGATCSMDLTGKTTHLIATHPSNKVKAAREYGHSIHIVTPNWLLDSTARWKIQNEDNYSLSQSIPSEDDEDETENDDSSIGKSKTDDIIENIDWDEADREVEDFINESGIDDVWEDTDSEVDSPRHTKRKRPVESGGESGGDGSEEDSSTPSSSTSNAALLALKRRKTRTLRGRSKLSKVTTAPSSTCTSGNTSDIDDCSSLDDLAGILDQEIE